MYCLCFYQSKQHMSSSIYFLLDLAQQRHQRTNDTAEISLRFERCCQDVNMKSFSVAVISTHNISTAKHLLRCLLCTWLRLRTWQAFIHITPHSEYQARELGCVRSAGQKTGLNQDMWNPFGPEVDLSTACHRSWCMELSPGAEQWNHTHNTPVLSR